MKRTRKQITKKAHDALRDLCEGFKKDVLKKGQELKKCRDELSWAEKRIVHNRSTIENLREDRDHWRSLAVAHNNALDIIRRLVIPEEKPDICRYARGGPPAVSSKLSLAVAPGDETPRKEGR